MKKNSALSTVILFIAAIIFGYAFVAQYYGGELLAPFTFTGIRFFLGSLSLVPVIFIIERDFSDKKKLLKTFLYAIAAGGAIFAAATLQQVGITYTSSSGVSGFITGLYNILTPIAYFLVFKKKTSVNVWIGAGISVFGLYLLCTSGGSFSIGVGELALLLSTLFWTAHILIVDRIVDEVYTLKFASMQFFINSVFCGIAAFIFERGSFSFANVKSAYIAILYCGLISVGIAYTFQIIGQKYATNPTNAAIILSTESVFSAIGGAQFGIDSISFTGYIGCAIIFVAIVLSQLPSGFFKRLFIGGEKK